MAGQLKRQGKNARGGGKDQLQESSGSAAPARAERAFWAIPSSEKDGDALDIAVDDISPNPFNEREMGDLTHLAESIAADGLMSDINVMHTAVFAKHYPGAADNITTKYVIAFGERRWRACQMAGKTEIPAVLRNDVVERIRRILFAENYHRKQLLPVEEAREFQRLQKEDGLTIRGIVAELKLSGPSYVSGRLKLLELPETLQRIVGTENGPGISAAKTIASGLSNPDDMLLVWNLIRDEGISVSEALRRFHAGDVPVLQENTVPEPRHADPTDAQPENASSAEDVDGPGERKTSGDSRKTSADRGAAGTATHTAAASGSVTTEEPGSGTTSRSNPQPSATKKALVDQEASQRAHASADRAMTCQNIVVQGITLTPEQVDGLFARALLAPTQQTAARASAQKWLREAGKAGFTISDTESYFEAVLSSGNPELVKNVTLVTALAACEVRARDGRRQWDVHDAEHVRLLIESGNHHPESVWERTQLKKHGVPFPVGDDADADPIN